MEAYVTVVRDDDEAIGAVVLAESLHILNIAANQRRHYVALINNKHIKPRSRQLLNDVYTHVYVTSELCGNDDLALWLLGKPEVSSTFAKINCWRLTQYNKCVYLNPDKLVLQNCEDLFEREELSAVPDVGWPDCFNAGVFVFKPSLHTYAQMLAMLQSTKKYNFQGGDQAFLNIFFKTWKENMSQRLPFVYNVFQTAHYTYGPAFKHFSSAIKIVHLSKPWSSSWPSSSHPSTDHMDTWAAIFKSKILPKLPSSAQDLVSNSLSGSATQLISRIYSPAPIHHPLPFQPQMYHQPTLPVEQPYHPAPEVHHPPSQSFSQPQHHTPPTPSAIEESQPKSSQEPLPVTQVVSEPLDPHWDAVFWNTVKQPWEPPAPLPIEDFQTVAESKRESEPAQLTFGWFSLDSGARPVATSHDQPQGSVSQVESSSLAEKTAVEADEEQAEEEEEIDPEERSANRKTAWEEGKMDYLGEDKFDNIWRRLENLLRDSDEAENENKLEDEALGLEERVEEEENEPEPEEVFEPYEEGDWSGMRNWEEGNMDYTGRDKSDNILKRLELVMSGSVVPHCYASNVN